MLYPIYIHPGNATEAHGVTLPDFPGCFSAADDWEGIPAAVQEAIELWFEGEDIEVPEPTALETLAQNDAYQGGVWMLVDVDTTRLTGPSKRINLTVPVGALRTIDAAARMHHESRSSFLTRAGLAMARREQNR